MLWVKIAVRMNRLSLTALITFFLAVAMANVIRADSLSDDETTIAADIKLLHSKNSDVREGAAKDLRKIVARYPSGTTDIRRKDGGEAYWMEKVNQIIPGMTAAEVKKIL